MYVSLEYGESSFLLPIVIPAEAGIHHPFRDFVDDRGSCPS